MEITAKFIMIFAERIYTILEIGTDLFPVFFYGNFSKKKKHLLFSGCLF